MNLLCDLSPPWNIFLIGGSFRVKELLTDIIGQVLMNGGYGVDTFFFIR